MKKIQQKKFQKFIPIIKILEKLKPEQRLQLAEYLNDDVYDFIFECMHNALHNKNFSADFRKCLKQKLKNNSADVRYIVNAKKSRRLRKKRLIQSGGFPSVIAAILSMLPVVLPLVKKGLNKIGVKI